MHYAVSKGRNLVFLGPNFEQAALVYKATEDSTFKQISSIEELTSLLNVDNECKGENCPCNDKGCPEKHGPQQECLDCYETGGPYTHSKGNCPLGLNKDGFLKRKLDKVITFGKKIFAKTEEVAIKKETVEPVKVYGCMGKLQQAFGEDEIKN